MNIFTKLEMSQNMLVEKTISKRMRFKCRLTRKIELKYSKLLYY